MVDKKEIMRLLNWYFRTTGTVTISDEGLVSCTGNVELKRKPKHEKLPVAFDRVSGYFGCWGNQLTTLEGAPQSVGGSFSCSGNQLTSLEHAPKIVGRDFWCNNNRLKSLEGLPAIPGTLFLSYRRKLPLLRCLLAQKVEFVPRQRNKKVQNILNKYAKQGRREMFWCQKELEDAGFPENARW